MSDRPHIRTVALEEHYQDAELAAYLKVVPKEPITSRLQDVAAGRLAMMDEAGIDLQILSLSPPGLQGVSAAGAVEMARRVNDRLAAIVKANPLRFAAFAALPTALPDAAADELDRAVSELGFKGAMIHGPTSGVFLDDKAFWPIFSRASKLRVPVYIHPSEILPAVRDAYFKGFVETHPMFLRAGWGYTIETGTHAMRLAQSGLFDAQPDLRVILGHLGEGIPFLLSRIDEALSRDTPMKNFREVFCRHFYVTTSGFFSSAALACTIEEMGADRVLFSVDWPYASSKAATAWFEKVLLSELDRAKMLSGNAGRLFRV